MAEILYGKPVAEKIKNEIKADIEKDNLDISLTIVRVGNDPASDVYVRNKVKACDEVGIRSRVVHFEDPDEFDRCQGIPNSLTFCGTCGLMLQLPLPAGWDEKHFINYIEPNQDADCLTDIMLGDFYSSNKPKLAPCTAQGIIDILDYYNIDIEGKHAVVVGRSNIVGRPIAHLLETRNATVTICHSKTEDLAKYTRDADILVVAIGKAKFITKDMIKENAIIIDVGINRDENNKLCGDVDFNDVLEKAGAVTPVPGGVGVLTVANLLKNTYKLYKGV